MLDLFLREFGVLGVGKVVIQLGLTPTRWCNAISVLLEKDPGSPEINRLRVIHIFEADYNKFLKTMWARRLVERGKKQISSGNLNKALVKVERPMTQFS